MVSDMPKSNVFAVRGLHMDTVVERMFHTETDEDRRSDIPCTSSASFPCRSWVRAIESVRDRLEPPVQELAQGMEVSLTIDKKVRRLLLLLLPPVPWLARCPWRTSS